MSVAVEEVKTPNLDSSRSDDKPFNGFLHYLWEHHQAKVQDFSLNATQIYIIREYLEKNSIPDGTTFGRVVDFLEGRLSKLDHGATLDWFNTDSNALLIKDKKVSPREYAQRLLKTSTVGQAILSYV